MSKNKRLQKESLIADIHLVESRVLITEGRVKVNGQTVTELVPK